MLFERDDNTLVGEIVEPQDIPEVLYNETQYLPILSMFSTENGLEGISYNLDLMRYISIELTQVIEDYTVEPKIIKTIDIGLRKCTEED